MTRLIQSELDKLAEIVEPAVFHGIVNYIEKHYPVGDFLTALFSNDLKMTVARADGHNQARLVEIVSWMYNYAPATCWGSVEDHKKWLEQK